MYVIIGLLLAIWTRRVTTIVLFMILWGVFYITGLVSNIDFSLLLPLLFIEGLLYDGLLRWAGLINMPEAIIKRYD